MQTLARWFALPLLVACAFAQRAPELPRFRASSVGVVVEAVVTDNKGNTVRGLTAQDFQVFENDAPQAITSFEGPAGAITEESKPGTKNGGPSSSSAVAPASARFVALIFDHGSLSPAGLKTAQESAASYVERAMTDHDYIAVYSTGGGLRMIAPFSNDRKRILDAIQAMSRRVNDAANNALARAAAKEDIARLQQDEDKAPNSLDRDMIKAERLALEAEIWIRDTWQARDLFVSLRAVAQAFAGLSGRKNVILFSEGYPHTPEAESEMAAVVDSANRANVAIYPVDPRGLMASKVDSAQQLREVTHRSINDIRGGYSKFDAMQRIGVENEYDDLREVANSTGGFVIKNQNDLLTSMLRIYRDLRECYTIIYTPANETYDGHFRRIKVTLASKGYKLRYRSGYAAIPPGEEALLTPAAAQLLASAQNGSMKSSFTPLLNAALLYSASGEVKVTATLWVPPYPGAFTKSGDGYNANIAMVIAVRNEKGGLADVRQRFLKLRLDNEQWREFQKVGLRLPATLTVPRHESLEVQGIVQYADGKAAIISTRLAMGGGAGSARATSLLLTPRVDAAKDSDDAASDPLRVQAYKLVLPKTTAFASTDNLTLYFGIGDLALDPASGRPLLKLELALKQGPKLLREIPVDSLYPLGNAKDRIFYLNQVPLGGLGAGAYSIEATVRDLAKKTSAIQTAAFTIE